MEIHDLLIVGAGLTGLNCAHNLSSVNKNLKIQILEKSKSCGGRMATRRIGEAKFDHGAQFIKIAEESEKIVSFWQEAKVAQNFPSQDFRAICGQSGMTHLTKKLAENLNVKYNCKVTRLEKNSEFWQVSLEEEEPQLARQIVLTCPLPQSLQILDQSNLGYDRRLAEIRYNQSIVLLVQLDSNLKSAPNYTENVDENIYSISSQKAKNLSAGHDYTIVMQNLWSKANFDKSDEEISSSTKTILNAKYPSANILDLFVKKWRFASPAKTWDRLFEMVTPNLYLAGDGFGGASLLGALRSSDHLVEHLNSSISNHDRQA